MHMLFSYVNCLNSMLEELKWLAWFWIVKGAFSSHWMRELNVWFEPMSKKWPPFNYFVRLNIYKKEKKTKSTKAYNFGQTKLLTCTSIRICYSIRATYYRNRFNSEKTKQNSSKIFLIFFYRCGPNWKRELISLKTPYKVGKILTEPNIGMYCFLPATTDKSV